MRKGQNRTRFHNGIQGKTLHHIEITNELDYRAIAIYFTDKTACCIEISIGLSGCVELADFKTGNLETVRRMGRIPAENHL